MWVAHPGARRHHLRIAPPIMRASAARVPTGLHLFPKSPSVRRSAARRGGRGNVPGSAFRDMNLVFTVVT